MSLDLALPEGRTLRLHPSRPRLLLIGEGAGIGPTLFVAERLRELTQAAPTQTSPPAPWRPLVLLGSTSLPFPFRPRPSVIVVPGIPTGVIACMPLLEEWGVASRLASTLDLPGCFDGTVTALAEAWLSTLTAPELTEVEIFPYGPDLMTQEAEQLSERYGTRCQIS